MDDIIIIVLTLLFTIVAAISQAKKKRANTVPKVPDFWKEILQGEVLSDVPESPEPVVPESTVKPSLRYAAPPVSAENMKIPAAEGLRNEIIAAVSGSKTEEPEDLPVREPFLEDFSFRKAIIFSEVINPKFFSINWYS